MDGGGASWGRGVWAADSGGRDGSMVLAPGREGVWRDGASALLPSCCQGPPDARRHGRGDTRGCPSRRRGPSWRRTPGPPLPPAAGARGPRGARPGVRARARPRPVRLHLPVRPLAPAGPGSNVPLTGASSRSPARGALERRTGVRRAVLGSVAQEVVARSRRPVLVVKHSALP
ncbi:universal stress protein [Corallococcus aberystwythensis]|uniref:Universal stress protein n=1 Tax=Corallococcus aberystwythensis TaxID=2316722 RepID=A0A3A8QMR5_9BACT|nr:universal stress protein [Corallococcus aberystwythensis]